LKYFGSGERVRFAQPGNCLGSAAALALAQDGGEIAASEGEALLDASGDRQFGAVARDAISFAEDPHGSGAIIDLKDSGSQRSKGIGNVSGDGDIFAGEPGWILVNLGNALAPRASR
jgi:hypothetical protein